MNILLGVCGATECTQVEDLHQALSELGTVRVVVTPTTAVTFFHDENLSRDWCFNDQDEMEAWQQSGRVLHVDMVEWADVLVIAPCTANTLAKMANGICDNMLLSIVRAWDRNKLFVVAPALQLQMAANLSFLNNHYTLLHSAFDKLVVVGEPLCSGMAEVEKIEATVRRLSESHRLV